MGKKIATKEKVTELFKTAVTNILAGDLSEFYCRVGDKKWPLFEEYIQTINERPFLITADNEDYLVTISKPR